MTSNNSSILFFIILTLLFFIFKHFSKSPETTKIWTIIYFCLLITVQFFINLNITNEVCGFSQTNVAFSTTLYPWLFIFGIIVFLLKMFPNWIDPFSNTIGYFFAIVGGVGSFLNSILNENLKVKGQEEEVVKAINYIYQDKSLLINSINFSNINQWWSSMLNGGLLKKNVGQVEFDKLYSFIKMKTEIGEFIWYLFAGILTTTISYNYIINSGCKQSVQEMEKRHNEYLEKEKKINESNKKKESEQIIYKSYE